MRVIKLDGRKMDNRAAAWAHIRAAFGFPDYFGNNLDALTDSLSECSGIAVELSYANAARNSLGQYARLIIGIFEEEANSRPDFLFREVQIKPFSEPPSRA